MDEIKKARLCWNAMSNAIETIRELYSSHQDWKDEDVKEQYYKAISVAVFFSEREDKLSGKS